MCALHEELMLKTIAEVIKQLINAEEMKQEISINKSVLCFLLLKYLMLNTNHIYWYVILNLIERSFAATCMLYNKYIL